MPPPLSSTLTPLSQQPMVRTRHLLVIGYGNTLRRDDGVGPRTAEAVQTAQLPGVQSLTAHQLNPEHAELIAQSSAVVFVDGSLDQSMGVRTRRIRPAKTSQWTAHTADPSTLLATARDVYGSVPDAWLITIPIAELGFGEGLSESAQLGVQQAVDAVRKIAQSLPLPTPASPSSPPKSVTPDPPR